MIGLVAENLIKVQDEEMGVDDGGFGIFMYENGDDGDDVTGIFL